MIALHVKYRFPPEKVDEAIGYFKKMQPASRAESGCLFYTIYQEKDDPAVFHIHEHWQDQAALEAHSATAHMKEYGINGLRVIAESRDVVFLNVLIPTP